MANHRTHSIEFKRQVAQEFLSGETLHGLSKRHDICRNLIRVWVQKYEAGASTRTSRPPICSSSMRLGSPPLNGLSASRRWNWSS
jgi:transposase-like protein